MKVDRKGCIMHGRMLAILAIIALFSQTAVWAESEAVQPSIYDGSADGRFISEGFGVLTVDYVGVMDNCVTETGTDYPYGRIWLILYNPTPYEKMDLMEEDAWDRTLELCRYELPGPSSTGRWADGDEVVFQSLGIYRWETNDFDRAVFRIVVEEPAKDTPVETLIWGSIQEDDTLNTTLEFGNESVAVYFRTLDLPETLLQPTVSFQDIWLEHNVNVGGYDGLKVHAKFQTESLRAQVIRLAAYVHYAHNGEPVPCQVNDPSFATPSGFLTVQQNFVPIYPATIFSDFALFIPYSAFPVSADYIDYQINIELLDAGWEAIGGAQSPVFSVLRPD